MPKYRGRPYWRHEEPIDVWTGRSLLRYYPRHGKLQVSNAAKQPGPDGVRRRFETVRLDREDLRAHPDALELLRQVVGDFEGGE